MLLTGVVAACKVVGGVLLAANQLLRVEQLAVGASADLWGGCGEGVQGVGGVVENDCKCKISKCTSMGCRNWPITFSINAVAHPWAKALRTYRCPLWQADNDNSVYVCVHAQVCGQAHTRTCVCTHARVFNPEWYLIDHGGLKVEEDAAGDVLASARLGKEGVESIVAAVAQLVARHLLESVVTNGGAYWYVLRKCVWAQQRSRHAASAACAAHGKRRELHSLQA